MLTATAFVLFLGLTSCKNDDDNAAFIAPIMLTANNLQGNWLISSAKKSIWEEGVGIIQTTDPNTDMQGQFVTFTTTDLIVQNSEGTATMPYIVNSSNNTITINIEDNETDIFNVNSFSLAAFNMNNPNPTAHDYNFDAEFNANVYEQHFLTLIKQ